MTDSSRANVTRKYSVGNSELFDTLTTAQLSLENILCTPRVKRYCRTELARSRSLILQDKSWMRQIRRTLCKLHLTRLWCIRGNIHKLVGGRIGFGSLEPLMAFMWYMYIRLRLRVHCYSNIALPNRPHFGWVGNTRWGYACCTALSP